MCWPRSGRRVRPRSAPLAGSRPASEADPYRPPPRRLASGAVGEQPPRSSAGIRLDEAFEAARPSGRLERIFGTRAFFRLWIAQVVSATGDWLGLVALIALADQLAPEGSKSTAIALVLIPRVAPGFFLATAVGVIVDRLNRKRVMVACDVGRALVLVTLPFVDTIVGLVVASFLLELLTMMWQPAKEATVPNLVPREKLTAANSLNVAAAYGMFPVAAGAAALLAKAAEAMPDEGWVTNLRLNEEGLAFYVDALSFLVTALIIWSIAIPSRTRDERRAMKRGSLDLGGAIRELREGWRLVGKNPIVRSVNVGLATAVMGAGMVILLGARFVDEVIVGREADFHAVLFSLGVGMAVGVGAASALQNRINRARGFTWSLMGAGVVLLVAASVDRLSLMIPLVVMLGMLAGPSYVLGFTLLHENVANEIRGRVFSALLVLVRLCFLIALTVGGVLTDLLDNLSDRWWDGFASVLGARVELPGVRLTLWLAALIIMVAGALATWSLRSAKRPPVAEPSAGPQQ
ncbi:MAG: MFS transporter [Acidimicrobiaceae bacterium]|nr:MFS transporter [Acidimicrobiaceae bacterium]MYG99740.1 MFS transporter [Acidimicrobiaceae bacterium]